MSNITSLNDFKYRDRPLEFSWSWDPKKFYPIRYSDVDRILYLLSIDDNPSGHSAIFRPRISSNKIKESKKRNLWKKFMNMLCSK